MKTDLGCVICGKTEWGNDETFIMEIDSNRTYEVLYCESHKYDHEKIRKLEVKLGIYKLRLTLLKKQSKEVSNDT